MWEIQSKGGGGGGGGRERERSSRVGGRAWRTEGSATEELALGLVLEGLRLDGPVWGQRRGRGPPHLLEPGHTGIRGRRERVRVRGEGGARLTCWNRVARMRGVERERVRARAGPAQPAGTGSHGSERGEEERENARGEGGRVGR